MGRPTVTTALAAPASMSAAIESPCSPSISCHKPSPLTPGSAISPLSAFPKSLSLRILVARHAETGMTCIRPRVLQGQTESELTTHGIKQAHALAHRLGKEHIDCIYSSDLCRARQTAEIVAGATGLNVLYDPRLREQNLGDLAGREWTEVKNALRAQGTSFEEHLRHTAPPAEPTDALRARVEAVYVDVVDRHLLAPHGIFVARTESNGLPGSNILQPPAASPSETPKAATAARLAPADNVPRDGQCVLLITHGGPIAQLIKHLLNDLGFRAPEVLTSRFPRVTGLYDIKLDCRASQWTGTLAKLNCVAHLAGLDALVLGSQGLQRDPAKYQRQKQQDEQAAINSKTTGSTATDNEAFFATGNPAGTVFSSFFGKHIVSNGSAQSTARKSLGW